MPYLRAEHNSTGRILYQMQWPVARSTQKLPAPHRRGRKTDQICNNHNPIPPSSRGGCYSRNAWWLRVPHRFQTICACVQYCLQGKAYTFVLYNPVHSQHPAPFFAPFPSSLPELFECRRSCSAQGQPPQNPSHSTFHQTCHADSAPASATGAQGLNGYGIRESRVLASDT